MAIHCMNPNTIGQEAEELFNITSTTGLQLIDSLNATIDSLKSHWKGSDAVTNLNNLALVYGGVVNFIKEFQNIITKANNNEIIPLQKHIVLSGGECTIGKELIVDITKSPEINVTVDAVESWTSPEIMQDSINFNDFPNKFQNFITDLKDKKNILLSNWLDGANRAGVETVINEFVKKAEENYLKSITLVRDNLNKVASIKKQLL